MNIIRFVILLIGFTVTGAVGCLHAELNALGQWESSSTLLPASGTPESAEVHTVKFSWKHETNQWIEEHSVAIIFVPGLHLYWMGYKDNRQFFVINKSIVGVAASQGDVLRFYPSSEPSTDGHELENVFRDRLAKFKKQYLDVKGISFAAENVLGAFPFTKTASARGEPAPTITKIDVGEDGFTVELAGGMNNAVTATITFDNAFKPVAATLNGKQVFPK